MDRYDWLILLAFVNHYVLCPLLQILWARWTRARQIRQAKQWQEENKILDEQERREAYKQAAIHADRVYVIRKYTK